jgi:hypothetical protein
MSNQTASDVIAQALTPTPLDEPVAFQRQLAERVLRALTAAGFEVMAPQDIEWGTCPQSDTGQHRVALNLCTWCLEYDPE